MADGLNSIAWENGQLRALVSGEKSREVTLAVPLSRLIVKIVRVPMEERADPVAFATPLLQAMSPYPDEPLTVSCETVGESEAGSVVLAAALPESANEDLADALDAAKLNVTRVDALAVGALRGLWGAVIGGSGEKARRLVLWGGADCHSAFVLDGDLPVVVRAVSLGDDLRREAMLCLLEAESFAGVAPLAEIVLAGAVEAAGLETLAPVRRVEIGEDAPLVGVAERSAEPTALNALPAAWREVLEETRFKAKLTKSLAVAGGLWAAVLLVLFGVPVVFGFMEDHQKTLCKEHARQYKAVREMKEKTELVRKYSDHSRGALEIMKAVSDRLPQGITLLSWNFKRDEGVKVSGEADSAELVYQFKDAMSAIDLTAGEGEEATGRVLFGEVVLTGPSARGTKQKFDLDCRYKTEGEEEDE
jgi:hypothetical protein